MCTNRALVDSLECYMDDLVDCFEDFVKKSVIVISVAVGLLVAMIAYVLKTVADRAQTPYVTDGPSRRVSQNSRNRNIFESNLMLMNRKDDKGSLTTDTAAADIPYYDEKVLKDIGFTGCTRPDCERRVGTKCQSVSSNRLSIPSLPTDSKKYSAPMLSQPGPKVDKDLKSCCSLCCDENYCER